MNPAIRVQISVGPTLLQNFFSQNTLSRNLSKPKSWISFMFSVKLENYDDFEENLAQENALSFCQFQQHRCIFNATILLSHATFTDKNDFNFIFTLFPIKNATKPFLLRLELDFTIQTVWDLRFENTSFKKWIKVWRAHYTLHIESKEQQIHLTTKKFHFSRTAFALIDVLFPKREKAFVFSIVNQKVDEADMRHKLLQFHHHLV